jgi:hypothetical protein
VDENCDIWADVDFGHGTVEVRCTKTGVHDDHKCEVVLCAQETTPIVEQWNENPLAVITVAALAATSAAKIIDAMSAAQGRKAYAKQINL